MRCIRGYASPAYASRPMIVVAVCAKNQVRKVVKRTSATHLISLLDPATRVVAPSRIVRGGHLSQVCFDTHDRAHFYVPQPRHIERISRWVTEQPEDARLVVHCVAGISRSTAVALAIAARTLGPEGAAAWLRENRSEATPNRLITRYFDELEGWNGRLLAAADTFPRPIWDESPDSHL